MQSQQPADGTYPPVAQCLQTGRTCFHMRSVCARIWHMGHFLSHKAPPRKQPAYGLIKAVVAAVSPLLQTADHTTTTMCGELLGLLNGSIPSRVMPVVEVPLAAYCRCIVCAGCLFLHKAVNLSRDVLEAACWNRRK
jgi:hypothetical protein